MENNDQIFFTIFRNITLKKLIYNLLISDTTIIASPSYFDENYKFFEPLDTNNREYNIKVHIFINNENISDYISCKQKDIYNSISFYNTVSQLQQIDIITNHLPKYIRNLSLVHEEVIKKGLVENLSTIETMTCLDFTQPIFPNTLPINLEEISFSAHNNNLLMLKDVFPQSIKYISWLANTNKLDLDFVFPTNTNLHINIDVDNENYKQVIDQLNQKALEFKNNNVKIKRLVLHYEANEQPFTPNFFPPTLEELYIYTFRDSLPPLANALFPDTLTRLKIRNLESKIQVGDLPANIRDLDLCSYGYPLTVGLLPQSLTKLKISEYNQPLEANVLPQSLKTLRLDGFNQILDCNILPCSLKKLILSNNTTLRQGCLPHGLESLSTIPETIKGFTSFPSTLTTLHLNHCKKRNMISIVPILPSTIHTFSLTLREGMAVGALQRLPTSIKNLSIYVRISNEIDRIDFLPNNLQKLSLECAYAIKFLTFTDPHTKPIVCDDRVPSSLRLLRITSHNRMFYTPPSFVTTLIVNEYLESIQHLPSPNVLSL
ncbi:hypothetical protein CYY_007558 [Polysphondylium violaceum]|uniref:Leucine-rich repeat containing protein n=1 Tax=Polysphondylium violaceum TaxID=133409 RepID=A0A8J4V4T7_9MYCE|nr:hypothetical protein CYY_007558 [Polysphondylium violaceum]